MLLYLVFLKIHMEQIFSDVYWTTKPFLKIPTHTLCVIFYWIAFYMYLLNILHNINLKLGYVIIKLSQSVTYFKILP